MKRKFLWMLEKKKHFAEKSHIVVEELQGGLFKHTKTFFFHKMSFYILFSPFIKNAFDTNSGLFSQKYACNKKGSNFIRHGLQIAAFQQWIFQWWWKRPILEGSLNQKPT